MKAHGPAGPPVAEANPAAPEPVHPLQIGFLLFDQLDQIDLTGPFEVLARLPGSTTRLYGKTTQPVRDVNGLRLQADARLADAPQLDVLVVPGGAGQEALMEDEEILGWLRRQAAGARCVLSVCTGALLLGAAGLLVGRRATTHWASAHLLSTFGAESAPQRVVTDDRFVFAAGVTAGIDGALRAAADLSGPETAQAIQLWIQYAPEPPFDAGTPETAPPHLVAAARRSSAPLTRRRATSAQKVASRLGRVEAGR